jgi:hypothetical membrane protein
MDDRSPLHRTPLLRLAGLLWLLAGATYLASETIAAAAFPGYSYARNYISDLGVAAAGVIDGRSVHSPLALVMNLGLLCDGALFVVASFVGAIALRAQRLPVGRALPLLGIAHGLGTMLVGAVPDGGEAAGPIPSLHVIGAGLSIVAGNLGMIMVGVRGRQIGARRGYQAASLMLGLFGLASLAMLEGNRVAALALGPDGLLERGSVYPITAWEIMTGLALLGLRPTRTDR